MNSLISIRTASRALAALLVLIPLAAGTFAAKPGLRAFFASDFKDMAYQEKAYKKVAAAWKMPEGLPKPGSKAVVISTIVKDGGLAEARLHYKSGSEAWDQAAVEAVKKAAPFEPLPGSYAGATVEVHFHFELNE